MSNLQPKQFAQQVWYHGGSPNFINADNYVHVGTRAAAEQRIDPSQWDEDDPDTFLPMRRNSGLYEVRLARGALIAPQVGKDEEFSDRLIHTEHGAQARRAAGKRGEVGEYDAYPYANEYEDEGRVSLYVNPEKLRMVRRLR